MGVDLRYGKRDYYTRYKVYPPKSDVRTALENINLCEGILHAKDVSSYNTDKLVIGGGFERDVVRAVIETSDRIEIQNGSLLYCIPEECWYVVENHAPNSYNPSQRRSSRPIIITQITIRKYA